MRFNPKKCLSVTAFTLTELLVVMAIFMFVVIAALYLHLFGLKLNQMVSVKVTATESARKVVSQLESEIRTAGIVRVGTGDLTGFTEAVFNTPQQGNGIQIYPDKTDTSSYIRYYLDASDNCLKRIISGEDTAKTVAWYVTNSVVFTSEDYAGNVLQNGSNNRVIGIMMQFYQIADTTSANSGPHYYDHYQLQTRISRRATE